jgi:hypothetical protein
MLPPQRKNMRQRLPNRPASEPSGSPGEPPAAPVDQEFLRETSYIPPTIDDAPAAPGAPDAEPENEAIPPEIIASALGPSFQAVFHFLATRRGDHWELLEFEKKALVQGWTPIMQYLLAKLGSQEQVMLALAVGSTAAIIGGKAAQDIKRASSTASTRTRGSAASSASSASAAPARPPAPSGSFEEQDE